MAWLQVSNQLKIWQILKEVGEPIKWLTFIILWEPFEKKNEEGKSCIIWNKLGSTWSKEKSVDSCDSIPATKASPAPVASTASTSKPCTLPLKSWKNYRIAIFRLLIIIKIRYFMPVLQHWTKRSNSYKCSDHHIKRLSISILWYGLWDIII